MRSNWWIGALALAGVAWWVGGLPAPERPEAPLPTPPSFYVPTTSDTEPEWMAATTTIADCPMVTVTTRPRLSIAPPCVVR